MYNHDAAESAPKSLEPTRFEHRAIRARQLRDRLACLCVFAIATTTLLHVACSMSTREKLTHFFFDVPSANSMAATNPPTDATQPADPGAEKTATTDNPLPQPHTQFVSIHPPYLERQCTVCHEADRSNRVSATIMDECSDCHEDYFGKNVEHPPVQRKECMKCHEPHISSQPHLLSRTLFRTCMQCHKKPENLSPESHSGDDVQNCTKCHDPHFGKSPMLKAEAKADPEATAPK